MSATAELHRRSTLREHHAGNEDPTKTLTLSNDHSDDFQDKYRRQHTAGLLAELLDEYRAAHQPKGEPAPKPKPTGIKPRGCILPVLVVLLLTIPLVGLCLPVFIVGAKQSDEEQLDFICLLYPLNRLASSSSAASALLRSLNATYVNSPVLQAWVAWAAAEEALLQDADNTTAKASAQAANERLMARQDRFFAALRRNCSTIAAVLWGRANEREHSFSGSGTSLYDSPAWTYWLKLNRQPWSPDQVPLAALPPPLAPPPPSPPPPPSVPPPPIGGAAALATQAAATNVSVIPADYEDYDSPPSPLAAQPRPLLFGIAAYVLVNATLISMDVVTGLARLNFEVHLGSLNPWAAAGARAAAAAGGRQWLLDEHDRLQQAGVTVNVDVVTATGGGLVTLSQGDRVGFKQLDIIVDVVKNNYFYPYDEYRAVVKLMSYVGNTTYRYPIAVLLNQRTAAVGWRQEVEALADVQENYMLWWSGSSQNQEGEVHLTYAITIKRSVFTKLFCVIILIGMWVLSGCAASYAVDLIFLRPREAALLDATLFVTLLFAMPNIRDVMPGVPAIGVGVDMFGFIWIMILCIISGSMIIATLVAQYVHPRPTLYDKATRNQVYWDWKEHERKREEKEKEEWERKQREMEQAEKLRKEPAAEYAGEGTSERQQQQQQRQQLEKGCGVGGRAAGEQKEGGAVVGAGDGSGGHQGQGQEQPRSKEHCIVDMGGGDGPENGGGRGSSGGGSGSGGGGKRYPQLYAAE